MSTTMKVRILAALLLLSVLANLILLALNPLPCESRIQELQNTVQLLEEKNAELEDRLRQESDRFLCPNWATTTETATLQAPAVLQRREIVRDGLVSRERIIQEGSMINVTAELRSGRGRILVETRPLMGEIFQDAANTAVLVAGNRSEVSLSATDVIFSIHAPQEVPAVDGPSAGALMTLLVLSVLEERPLLENVTLTGTIRADGQIGGIGGLLEKAQAAHDAGKDRFLIPRENARMVRYVEIARDLYGFKIIEQHPEAVDAEEYLESTVGIDVAYIDTIEEVMELATSGA